MKIPLLNVHLAGLHTEGRHLDCVCTRDFQRWMLSIFSDLVKRTLEVFINDFTIYDESFDNCLLNLE